MTFKKILLTSLVLVFSQHANALIVSVSGSGSIIAAPADVSDDAAITTPVDTQNGFNEAQNVLLVSALNVDGGSIGAGTRVNSHMIFLNSVDTALSTASAEWVFDGVILGVMSDYTGSLEINSSALLGNGSTFYPNTTFNARGLEGADTYAVSGSTLSLSMNVTEPGDWIRVITATSVPEPGSLALIALGLIGLSFRRRVS